MQRKGVINIFFAGECLSPDLNLFDYAIVFDNKLRLNDRISKIPAKDFFACRLTEEFGKTLENPQEELSHKTKFCNFIYSNGKAHPNRDKLFYKISEYKKVGALGKHLRNVDLKEQFVDESIKRDYKFTIASENACYEGYTSEKLLTAFQAHTIPIYWGDPAVEEFYNPKAFINANKLSFDDVVNKIKELDTNDDLYCQMLSESPMTKEQIEKYERCHDEYLSFITHIFDQPIDKAKRVAEGFHPDNYRRFAAAIQSQNVYKEPVKQINLLYALTDNGKFSLYCLNKKIFSYKKRKK